MSALRQHLIDPEICIRCSTCIEMCQQDAISYDGVNVVVDYKICNKSMDCIAPCPTGAIDNWRIVAQPYSVDEQFGWEELPVEQESATDTDAVVEAVEEEVGQILETAHAGAGGATVAPKSASRPNINVYTRANPVTARVQGNFRITDAGTESDVHHIVLDLGTHAVPILEGQSLGVITPGKDEHGRDHVLRLYSTCSPRDGERPNHNNFAFTVKRVLHNEGGEVVRGVASNYLCDLNKGDQVQLTGPYGSTFLMPDSADANIIMICTGTGSAPFRAMTERRRRSMQDAPGTLLLFFGARTPGELPYFGPLMKLPDTLIQKELVFSREPGKPKEYVQDRIRQRAATVADLLRSEDTYVYVCGLKGMEQGVEDALAQICSDHELDWPALRGRMRGDGRYHVETY